MPRLPILHAQGAPARPLSLHPDEQEFGAIEEGARRFGGSLRALTERVQQHADELDAVAAISDYDVQAQELHEAILRDTSLLTTDERVKAYKDRLHELRRTIATDHTPAVQQAIHRHALAGMGERLIRLRAEDTKRIVQDNRVRLGHAVDRAADLEAYALSTLDLEERQGEKAAAARLHRDNLLDRAVEVGTITPEERREWAEKATNRTWEQVAQRNPDYLLRLHAGVLAGEGVPAGMDPTKLQHYANIAQAAVAQRRADDERAVKARHEATAQRVVADLLEGTPLETSIPELVRRGDLDATTARTLSELQTKLITGPHPANYVPGFAGQLEASLRALKYSEAPLDPATGDQLVKHFLDGSITQSEMTHLMSVWQATVDHRNQTGHESNNRAVAHAHDVLMDALQTAGPLDKFDAFAKQVVREAREYYYRQVEARPQENPWTIMRETEELFKPVLKERLGLDAKDVARLDEAKMQALLKAKAITPAAYRAWQEQRQADLGRALVEETQRALPPPVPASDFQRWLDRVKQWFPKRKETP